MDFFSRQDDARRRSGWLVGLFCLAVLCTIILVYGAVLLAGFFLWTEPSYSQMNPPAFVWWRPMVFFITFLTTLVVVLLGSLMKIAALSSQGGAGVALMLGGREVLPSTENYFERRLRNVVEEMAIASGTPVPRVFILERQQSINAFAAGARPAEAVVAVSKGCLEGLTRDELQGVVAHEFSHILNGDMGLNLHLIGWLHGLLAIAVTGRLVIEIVGNSEMRVSRSRSEKGDFRIVVLLFGFALLVIGSVGQFFCRWIQAAVSRSRERLADASAVQFTRNPGGIANALIKIGRIENGSRISHPKAVEAGHLFFANGVRFSGFATHPPLEERIGWLYPQFDGKFLPATLEDFRNEVVRMEEVPPEELKEKKPNVVDLFTDPQRLAVAGAVMGQTGGGGRAAAPADPKTLLEQVGEPMQEHVERARSLLAAIPDELRRHLQDPHGARVVVYWLLLHPEEAVRVRQMDLLAQRLDPDMLSLLHDASPALEVLTPETRLPVLDLALPVLRTLSPNQYTAFRGLVDALIFMDEKIDLGEFVLRKLLHHHLDPEFGLRPRRTAVEIYALRGLAKEASMVLSALAQCGHSGESPAREAFDAAVQSLQKTRGEYAWCPPEELEWASLDGALQRLQVGSFQVKRWFLGASLLCMTHDHCMTVEEVELFRVIADLLDCPVPPWVAPS